MKFPVFLFAFLTLVVSESQAAACGCEQRTPTAAYRAADAVVVGRVLSVTPVEKFSAPQRDPAVEIRVQVEESLKNAPDVTEGGIFLLHSAVPKQTCMGYPFKEGEDYVIFAYRRRNETREPWSLYNFPSGTYDVGGLCGGTVPAREVTVQQRRFLKLLGEEMEAKKKKGFFGGILNR